MKCFCKNTAENGTKSSDWQLGAESRAQQWQESVCPCLGAVTSSGIEARANQERLIGLDLPLTGVGDAGWVYCYRCGSAF